MTLQSSTVVALPPDAAQLSQAGTIGGPASGMQQGDEYASAR